MTAHLSTAAASRLSVMTLCRKCGSVVYEKLAVAPAESPVWLSVNARLPDGVKALT